MRISRERWRKLLGLGALAGITAGGVALVRDERRRRAYEPDEIRRRLHERHAAAADAESTSPTRR